MHVAIVSETYPPEINGVALTVEKFVQTLGAAGHRVSLVRPRRGDDAATADETLVSSIPLPRYPGLRIGMPAHRALRRAWQRSRPDAVYVATEGPLGWSAVRVARALGLPCATGFHTRFDEFVAHYGAAFLSRSVLDLLRKFHDGADATLVPTIELKRFLEESSFRHVRLLARGVDLSAFDPALRDDDLRACWGVEPHDLAVVHVGRLAAEKNLDLVVDAFEAIRRDEPRAKLVWVGDGPVLETLRRTRPADHFAGMRRGADLGAHFASGDLFLFPSLTETFGNVTLEALASGVPVVAFDYGAAREAVRDGGNGRAVAFGDRDGFVRAACDLARDRSRLRRMSMAARASVADRTHAAVARALVELFEELAVERAVAT